MAQKTEGETVAGILIDKAQKLYDALEKLGKKKERLLIWSFFILLVAGVVTLMGTAVSGFHLVDDWEFARYVDIMTVEGKSLWECMKGAVGFDITIRFRPLYYINRVLMTAVFGINLTAMSVVKAAEIVLALGTLYYCARQMRCNVVYSLLFSLTVMVGYQSAVWWKLGPQESYDIMMFSIGFYFLLRWLRTEKRRYEIFSIGALFLMSIYKEPFILLLPFVMLYTVYEQMKGQKVTIPNLWNAVKARFSYLLIIGLIFLIEMILIVFVIGTNNYTYVGLDSAITLSEYGEIWSKAFHADLKWYGRFGTLFFLITLTYWEQLKKLGWEILLALSVVLPQVVSYSKTAMTERYILPAVFGFAFFYIIVCCNWKALSGKRRGVYMLGLLLMLAAHGRVMLREAHYFAYRGNGIQTTLEKTLEYTKEHEDAKVLSCFGPNIEGNRTIYHWMRIHGYDDVFYWTEEKLKIAKWFGEHEDDQELFENIDVIVMYNKEDRHWCYEPSLDLSDFTEYKYNTITMYIRNQ